MLFENVQHDLSWPTGASSFAFFIFPEAKGFNRNAESLRKFLLIVAEFFTKIAYSFTRPHLMIPWFFHCKPRVKKNPVIITNSALTIKLVLITIFPYLSRRIFISIALN